MFVTPFFDMQTPPIDYQPIAAALASLTTAYRDRLYAWAEYTTPTTLLLDPKQLAKLFRKVSKYCHTDKTDDPDNHKVFEAINTLRTALKDHGKLTLDDENFSWAYNKECNRLVYEMNREARKLLHEAVLARFAAKAQARLRKAGAAVEPPPPPPPPETVFGYRGKRFDILNILSQLLPKANVTLDSVFAETKLYTSRKRKGSLKYARLVGFHGKTVKQMIELVRAAPEQYFQIDRKRLLVREGLREDLTPRARNTGGTYISRAPQLCLRR